VQAHVVYPEDNIQDGACPSSHPTRLPHIFAENQFNVHAMVGKFKPNTFTLAMGDPTGYGWHFDFFNGWDDGAIPELINSCPQGEYGNEDIGSCPSFKAGGPTNSCPLKTTFKENVDTPGKYLPGCNPVSKNNPAPMYATSPLDTSSNDCKLASGGPPPSNPSGSPPSEPSTTTAAHSTTTTGSGVTTSPPVSIPTKSSTLMTSTKTKTSRSVPTTPSSGDGSDISCPESDRKTYTIGGKTFNVQCGVDHHGGDMKSATAHSLGECVSLCAETEGCVDVSLSGVACYMKSTLGEREKNSSINGAKLVGSGKPGKAASPPPNYGQHKRHLARHAQRYAL